MTDPRDPQEPDFDALLRGDEAADDAVNTDAMHVAGPADPAEDDVEVLAEEFATDTGEIVIGEATAAADAGFEVDEDAVAAATPEARIPSPPADDAPPVGWSLSGDVEADPPTREFDAVDEHEPVFVSEASLAERESREGEREPAEPTPLFEGLRTTPDEHAVSPSGDPFWLEGAEPSAAASAEAEADPADIRPGVAAEPVTEAVIGESADRPIETPEPASDSTPSILDVQSAVQSAPRPNAHRESAPIGSYDLNDIPDDWSSIAPTNVVRPLADHTTGEFEALQQGVREEHERLTGEVPDLAEQIQRASNSGEFEPLAGMGEPGTIGGMTGTPEPASASFGEPLMVPVAASPSPGEHSPVPAEPEAQAGPQAAPSDAEAVAAAALAAPSATGAATAATAAALIADEAERAEASGDRQAILHPTEPDTDDPLSQAAINRVRHWLAREGDGVKKRDRSAERLAGLLKDPKGLDFAIGFVDRVVRPEDTRVSAREFDRLSRDLPDFLDWYLKAAITMGGGFAPLMPGMVVPMAKRAMRQMVSHLVIDARPEKLGKHLGRLREDGTRLNVNLLGEAVLGETEAEGRLKGTIELLQRDDVDYVSIKVSSMAPQLNMWAFDETVERVIERLLPLYRIAAGAAAPKFINLDMEEYRDLDLTIAVFTGILNRPEFARLEAGIVLQAYLPDAQGAMERLTEWARARKERGGAGIKVRVVKGANLAMERVDATVHDWPLAVQPSKAASDANYKRVLRAALRPENAHAVRIGVAGHNLFDLAYAIELGRQHGTLEALDVEMLLGMADEHIDAVREDIPRVLLYTPVVRPSDFDAAVAYLVRRLEENGSGENFMSGMFEIGTDLTVWNRERDRFLASIALMNEQDARGPQTPNRWQNRGGDAQVAMSDPQAHAGFFNEPDTDPSLAANRAWGRSILSRVPTSETGLGTLERNHIDDVATMERRIQKATEAAKAWQARGAAERRSILYEAALTLGAYRGRLLETMASETGKTLAEGDPEISEAIDFCRYYGDQALELERTEHATFVPVDLTVVTPPWNFPVAIPCGGVTSALATGSAVIIKPAQLARRSAAVMCEALWEAGVPRDVLVLCDISDRTVSKHLITHESVGRLILTGSSETAAMFASWRPELPILAETSGKNGIIVTPSADLDLAAADLVKSAFGHAGQKCSAASLAILVGSVGTSERFRRQVVDAVTALRVGYPSDARVHMGPIIEPAEGKLGRALTTLEEGEEWLVEPQQLDGTKRLFSPAVRIGVQPGSYTHLTEFFGPHLSIITVDTLDEAIAVQNATDFGLTAGIHSLDADEVAQWLDEVEAGNLYVNRGITGAIVRRQPFGGWKLSQVGPGAKAGGPNYLATLGDWHPVFDAPKKNVKLQGLDARVAGIIEAATPQLDFLEFDRVRAGANSDQEAWDAEFGSSRDVSALGVERNVFRYRPTREVLVRLPESGTMGQLMRVIAAATRAGATIRISSSKPVPPHVVAMTLKSEPLLNVEWIVVESDAEFHARVASGEALAPVTSDDGYGGSRAGDPVRRIRLAGTDAKLVEVLAGNPRVALYDAPVTTEGRLELLPFLREQAVSVTAHRFGNPDKTFTALPI